MSDESNAFDNFAELIQAERAPRPLFILGAAKIDSLLGDILSAYLLPKSATGKKEDELLFGDTPLSTFSSRIKVCYRLGLIDITFYKVLEKFRAIRNSCAHDISLDLSISPMREHVADLRRMMKDRRSFALIKGRYFEPEALAFIDELQCLVLTICVLLESVEGSTKRSQGQANTIKISSR